MMRRLSVLICLFFTICSRGTYGQEAQMLHYTTADGLPSNTVYGLYKDSKGFLWFATDKGVSRYNGIKFENYTIFNGLAGNEVFTCREDGQQRLWMNTYNGALCFYKDGSFHTSANTPYLKTIVKLPFISLLLPQSDGSMIIAFHNQSVFINIDSNQSKVYDLRKLGINGSPEILLDVRKISKNRFRIITNSRTAIIDTNNRLLFSKDEDSLHFTNSLWGDKAYLLELSGIYTTDRKPVIRFNATHSMRAYANDSGHQYQTIFQFFSDSIFSFLCTTNGVWVNDSIQLLKNSVAPCMQKDKDGNYWFCSLHNGVYKANADFFSIKAYRNSYKDAVVYAFMRNGILYFSTKNDFLNRLADSGATMPVLKMNPNVSREHSGYVIDDHGNIFFIYSGKRNHLLFTKQSRGLTIYGLSYSSSWKKLFINSNKILFVEEDSLAYINIPEIKAGKTITRHPVIGHEYKKRIFGSSTDSMGCLWYSTINHVYKLKDDSVLIQPQFNEIAFKWMEIYSNYMIGATPEDRLVICNHFTSNKVFADTVNENCTWNRAYKLDNRHILISADNKYRIITLIPSLGKPIYSVHTIENQFIPADAEYIYADGNYCWFFKDGSIFKAPIKELLQDNKPPVLLFMSLRTKTDTTNFTNQSPEITIPFENAGQIVVSFAVLSFNSANVNYEYTLTKGEYDTWHSLTNEEIRLLAPSPGDYELKIRAKTLTSPYCKPIVMHLTIKTPWWRSSGFLILYALFIIVVIALIVRAIIKIRLHKKEQKHAEDIRFLKSEYKALNALMNPHFIFNSLNSIQNLVNENDREAANQYLQYFSDMVRQNMHNVSKEVIPLQKELDLLTNYLRLEELRFHGWLNYKIDISEDVETEFIMIPPLLIQPIVENAIKHGLLPRQSEHNCVFIKVYEEDDIVVIEVQDNGIGYKHSAGMPGHLSYGLSNIQKRIEQLSQINKQQIMFTMDELYTSEGTTNGTIATIKIKTGNI